MTSRSLLRSACALLMTLGAAASIGTPTAGAVETTDTIRTIAGTGTEGHGVDVPAPGDVLTPLDYPVSVAIGPDGSTYIADRDNVRIRVIKPDGSQTDFAGTGSSVGADGVTGIGGPATSFQLDRPSGIAVDSNGVVYIADFGHDKVFAVGTDGIITLFAGDGVGENDGNDGVPAIGESLKNPFDVAVSSDLIVYISEITNDRVRMVPTTGPQAGLVSTFAGDTAGASSALGTDGTAATTWHLNQPRGISVDKNDDVYIADSGNHRVIKVERDAGDGLGGLHDEATRIAGTGTLGNDVNDTPQAATAAAVSSPAGVAVDHDLNIYVSDTGNSAVHKISPGGIITRIAGAATDAPGTTGVALAATVANPQGLATDRHGSLFIAANGNDSILKIVAPDVQVPVVTITSPLAVVSTESSPADSVTVEGGAPQTVRFGCSDDYTGVLSCSATLNGTAVTDGHSIDTSAAGNQVLVVTALDNAVTPNTTMMTVTITVTAAGSGSESHSRVINGPFASASGDEGSIARLYMAILQRQPDAEGLNYWVGELEADRMLLSEIAAYFISQDEFQSLYGDADVAGFVQLLYLNVMDRDSAADSGGEAFWERVLGDKSWTRDQVASWFSHSPEFRGLTQTY